MELRNPVRRDMFRLAHAHGTLLNLIPIAAAICDRFELIRFGRGTSWGLRVAVVPLPLGFFLAGLWHFGDDPGIGIFLVPTGALLLLVVALPLAFSVRRK